MHAKSFTALLHLQQSSRQGGCNHTAITFAALHPPHGNDLRCDAAFAIPTHADSPCLLLPAMTPLEGSGSCEPARTTRPVAFTAAPKRYATAPKQRKFARRRLAMCSELQKHCAFPALFGQVKWQKHSQQRSRFIASNKDCLVCEGR